MRQSQDFYVRNRFEGNSGKVKRSVRLRKIGLVVGLFLGIGSAFAQSFPPDPQNMCPLPASTFNKWFGAGQPTLNGFVNPANSITLDTSQNQNFYLWSYQMFLWLTSPAAKYGQGRTFFSPIFYAVSPPNASGNRTITQFKGGPLRLGTTVNRPGINDPSFVIDMHGRMRDVEPAKRSARNLPLLRLSNGSTVEIADVKALKGHVPVFLDRAGKAISHVLPMFSAKMAHSGLLQKIVVKGRAFFLDENGDIVETETQQADGGVQLTQNGSIVYYATMVNDVYAWYLQYAKTQQPPITVFPTTLQQVMPAVILAQKHGVVLSDVKALCMEVKTSWVDASALKNPQDYVIMNATFTTYTQTAGASVWKPSGTKTGPVALVGMHVVGSAQSHPEMLWATFEHLGNSPNASYSYYSTGSSSPVPWPQDTYPPSGTQWLFCPSGSTGPFNQMRALMKSNDPNIYAAVAGGSIGPSTAIRFQPFGADNVNPPNKLVTNPAQSNTQILSLNQNVSTLMPVGDVRDNYYFVGAAWSSSGAYPTTYAYPLGNPPGNVVGTGQLANSTMETFRDSSVAYAPTNGCFFCHRSNTTSVSHVFGSITPPFSVKKNAKMKLISEILHR